MIFFIKIAFFNRFKSSWFLKNITCLEVIPGVILLDSRRRERHVFASGQSTILISGTGSSSSCSIARESLRIRKHKPKALPLSFFSRTNGANSRKYSAKKRTLKPVPPSSFLSKKINFSSSKTTDAFCLLRTS